MELEESPMQIALCFLIEHKPKNALCNIGFSVTILYSVENRISSYIHNTVALQNRYM